MRVLAPGRMSLPEPSLLLKFDANYWLFFLRLVFILEHSNREFPRAKHKQPEDLDGSLVPSIDPRPLVFRRCKVVSDAGPTKTVLLLPI
jgi:hypothetical protein